MTASEFDKALRHFIRDCVPNVDAAELLLVLAREPEREFDLRELVELLRPADVTEAILRKYLSVFGGCNLVTQKADRYRLAPTAAESAGIVQALAKLYNERPVTLVRMIYSLREERLRAFADAFKLKKT